MTNEQANYGKLGITSLPRITRFISLGAVDNRHGESSRPQQRPLAYEAHLVPVFVQ